MRKFGEAIKKGQKYKIRPGAYAILWNGQSLLTTFQAEPEPEFQLPGGGIDAGESPLPALVREVYEETGYSISGIRKLGSYKRFTYMPEYDLWAEKIAHVYLARPALRHGPPLEPDHTPVWMSPAEAVDMLAAEGDRVFVSELFGL